VSYKGKQKHIGVYEDEVEAARAYDKAARKVKGSRARVNFPQAGLGED
jgi:hypothetical protein